MQIDRWLVLLYLRLFFLVCSLYAASLRILLYFYVFMKSRKLIFEVVIQMSVLNGCEHKTSFDYSITEDNSKYLHICMILSQAKK